MEVVEDGGGGVRGGCRGCRWGVREGSLSGGGKGTVEGFGWGDWAAAWDGFEVAVVVAGREGARDWGRFYGGGVPGFEAVVLADCVEGGWSAGSVAAGVGRQERVAKKAGLRCHGSD